MEAQAEPKGQPAFPPPLRGRGHAPRAMFLTAEEIAQEHFDPKLLEGFGSLMAANEVISHCELLIASGDVAEIGGNK